MSRRQQIVDLIKDIPNDEDWVLTFMRKLQENEPGVYKSMMEKIEEKIRKEKEA